jgi:hypothetical protein
VAASGVWCVVLVFGVMCVCGGGGGVVRLQKIQLHHGAVPNHRLTAQPTHPCICDEEREQRESRVLACEESMSTFNNYVHASQSASTHNQHIDRKGRGQIDVQTDSNKQAQEHKHKREKNTNKHKKPHVYAASLNPTPSTATSVTGADCVPTTLISLLSVGTTNLVVVGGAPVPL